MTSFLDRVLREKETELAAKRRSRPVAELMESAAGLPVRSFREAIAGSGAIIAEIKRRSPTVAAFPQGDDPERLARIYEANGARAISIVTDERNFGTSLADVGLVRSASRLPVLVKDFIVDDYQVIEARAAGADAVLLIARILSQEALASLLALTRRLGMCALFECHDEEDIGKAIGAGAGIIGINNRNLGTLEVSVETTRQLVSKIPKDALCVSESGIDSHEVILALRSLGVDAFLVGGALLQSDAPGERLRELLGRAGSAPSHARWGTERASERSGTERVPACSGPEGEGTCSGPGERQTRGKVQEGDVRVKICGVTSPDDAVACHALGVDYIGVILAESRRRVSPERARAIRGAVPEADLVGVFADEDLPAVAEVARFAGLDLIQLHGDEAPDYCEALFARVALPIIKSFREGELPTPSDLAAYGAVDFVLFDLDKRAPDGGRTPEGLWAEAARAARCGYRVFLAGALDPSNVRTAVERTAPFCVDVCSGVEGEPGAKDIDAVERFITEVRG